MRPRCGPMGQRRRHADGWLRPGRLALGAVALLVLCATAPARAAEPTAQPRATDLPQDATLTRAQARGRQVTAIALQGLERTQPVVVRRELLIGVGRPLSLEALDESVQRLNNLGIFRLVQARLHPDGPQGVRVVLEHDEKWTLLPIFTAGRGGGLLYLYVGATETNLLGRYIETGANYYYLGGTHSGAIWLEDPRLLHRRLSGRLQAGVDNRLRLLYGDDGHRRGAWSRRRLFVMGEVQADIDPRWLQVGGALVVTHDTFGDFLLSPALKALNSERGLVFPDNRRDVIARATVRVGRINRTDYFMHGTALLGQLSLAPGWLGSEQPFVQGTLSGFGYLRFGATGNLAARVMLGAISEAVPERLFYVGGLQYRRGFVDSRFAGTHMWNANLEARMSSLHRRMVALQHVVFCDLGAVGGSGAELLEASRRPPVSVGTGVRLMLPLIARFVARLDFAVAFDDGAQWRVSFGSQQFF